MTRRVLDKLSVKKFGLTCCPLGLETEELIARLLGEIIMDYVGTFSTFFPKKFHNRLLGGGGSE